MISEEFLYAFMEAWSSGNLANLPVFRDSSELTMDEQLYLGSDVVARLASESSTLNPLQVEVMPSREGFSIGIALQGDMKVCPSKTPYTTMNTVCLLHSTTFCTN